MAKPQTSAGCRHRAGAARGPIRSFLRDHGLTIVLISLFLGALCGMCLSGWSAHNATLAEHGRAPLGLLAYLASGDFGTALFENWESEFLQMSAYVVLTAFLFQRGSAESRDPEGREGDGEEAPRDVASFLYAYSLGIALAAMFVASFLLHLWASQRAAVAEAALHGNQSSLSARLGSPEFWFESFQNWQSEFLATAALVLLSIVLRFRGSPESKRVGASHRKTGR